MKKLIILIICVFTLTCSFISCSLQTSPQLIESLKIDFPTWPPEDSLQDLYPPLSRWKISVYCADFKKTFYTTENFVEVGLYKNRPFCLIAQPITLMQDNKESDFFKPAGFIYPWNGNETCASWESGFLAELMLRIFKDGNENKIPVVETEYTISTYNWKKANQTIEKKIKESQNTDKTKENNSKKTPFYNPWLLDSSKIPEGIVSHDFKTAYLNLQSSYSINIDFEKCIFFSSFIPENEFLQAEGRLTVKKNEAQIICSAQYNITGIYILYNSAKKILLEFIYLPIYIEEI